MWTDEQCQDGGHDTVIAPRANAHGNPSRLECGCPALGSAILKVVNAEKAPLRLFFGEHPTQLAPHIYQQRLEAWAEWAPVSREAEGK